MYALIEKKEGTNSGSGGFTVLYSVLVASLVLILGVAFTNIMIKELRLSASIRDSQFAFYSADSGVECVLYHDIKGTDVFATSTQSVPPVSNIFCNDIDIILGNGSDIPPWTIDATAVAATTTFQVNYPPPADYCAIVSVGKSDAGASTRIESRGYNTCDASSPRRVERGIRITYEL